MIRCTLCILILLGTVQVGWTDAQPYVNSIGMKLVRIQPGSFIMGSNDALDA